MRYRFLAWEAEDSVSLYSGLLWYGSENRSGQYVYPEHGSWGSGSEYMSGQAVSRYSHSLS